MGVFFAVIGVLGYLVTGLIFMSAATSIQEILAGVGAITATLFFVGGAVISELHSVSKKLDQKS